MQMKWITMKIFKLSFLYVMMASPLMAGLVEDKKDELQAARPSHEMIQVETTRYNDEVKTINEKMDRLIEQIGSKITALTEENEVVEELGKLQQEKKRLGQHYQSQVSHHDLDYVIFEHEETTVQNLVLELGSHDHFYIISQEIAPIKVAIQSKLPIPRHSWSELIEMILNQYGIGVRQVNPFIRQLYLMRNDLLTVKLITAERHALMKLKPFDRVIYIFNPEPEHFKNAYHFFERFRDPKRMFVYSIGNKLAVVATKDEVEKLLDLYDAVWKKASKKVSKVVSLTKVASDEMLKILKAYFGNIAEGDKFSVLRGVNEIAILPLATENALVLVGSQDLVDNAQQLIARTELQIEKPCEMTIFWYNCKHSEPQDLADVMEKVYHSLICYSLDQESHPITQQQNVKIEFQDAQDPNLYNGEVISSPDGTMTKASNVVDPPAALPGTIASQTKASKTQHFIPHPKTGSLMMVVRKDTLVKIKEVLKKLDVPKKMVQIEVLLCERKLRNQTNSGLTLLKLGTSASGQKKTAVDFESASATRLQGVFEFLVSRPKGSFPAFDITYNFLMTQEDIQINASPSVTTVNQTPATISLVEEISINNGAAPINNNSTITFEKSYTRAQFGITLVMKPTVHDKDPDQGVDDTLITLDTNVTFDTPLNDRDDRPRINRRHIENQVRVVDGQTIILGGLRRKSQESTSTKIPFLGEIPGIAKLFGSTLMHDQMTETFVFITPKVIHDVKKDLEKMRLELLSKRPGDVPEFCDKLFEAQTKQKKKLFAQSFKLFFGNP
jgi:general secretion pathway protein D